MSVVCRACGAEIAEKALICYRCGAPTATPALKPPDPPGSSTALVATVLVLVALGGAAVFLQVAAQTPALKAAAWVVLGIAIVLVVAFRWRRPS
jgi:hypothetical protein